MAHIIIKNIGPIKNVELDLNKINVFMGPQSSGKSTIAKIISYCSWFEKNTILSTKQQKDFYNELLEFHNLEDGYFSDDSYLEYESENCHIIFHGKNVENLVVHTDVNSKNIFRNEKIEYIPAERNFVTIKGIGKYNETRDNVMSFLYDWFDAKQNWNTTKDILLPLQSLDGVSFMYDKENDSDNVILKDGTCIKLRHASSGLMSVAPLIVVFDYVINTIYSKERQKSPFEIINIKAKLGNLNMEQIETLQKMLSNIDSTDDKRTVKELYDIQRNLNIAIGFDSDYNYSKVIIEEPELNLFPETQQKLMYYMLAQINASEREHQLVITTHSPYILFSLNNCMMGGLVRDNVPEEKRESFESYKSWIDPKKVSIYEIHDGRLENIQDEDGIIEDNYLNQAYKENSAEYLSLLNYYDDDEE